MIPILTLLLFLYVDNRSKQKSKIDEPRRKSHVYDYIFLSLVAIISYQKQDLIFLLLAAISMVDYREKIIENSLNFLILIFSTPRLLILGFPSINSHLFISGIIIFIVLIIYSLAGGGIGFGDIKLMLSLAISRGEGFLLSNMFFTGILIFIRASISLIKDKNTGLKIPLGPYIFFSTLIIGI